MAPSIPYCPQLKQLAADFGYPLTFLIRNNPNDCCPPDTADPGVICNAYGGSGTQVLGLKWTPTGTKLTGNFNNANWAYLTDLTTIDMSNQNLSGSLPSFITSNTKLTSVKIQGNKITGSLPSFPGLLVSGNYSNNLFSGDIPSMPGTTTSLDLSNNEFTGSLSGISGSMVTFDVSNNKLTGIGGFPGSLTSVDISGNRFTGAIPILPTNMINFVANNNQFTSGTPTSFSNNLITFIANNNSLTGSLPVSLNRVTTLDVSFNLLSGVVPAVPSGVLLLKLQNNQFSSVGLLSASLSTTSCDISSNLFYSWSAPSWVGKCLMNNLLTTTNLRTTTTTKAATNLAKTTTQATKTISINQVVTTINTSLNTLPLSNWNTLADLPTTMVLIDSILEFPTTMPIETIDPRVYDLSRLSNSNTFTNSNTGEQPIATQIITTVFLADASLFSPIALIIIIFLLTIIIAGCSIEICLRQTKTKSGDARSFFSRNTRKDIRDAWKSFIPVPSRRNSKTTTIATTMSEKTFYKRQAREIN